MMVRKFSSNQPPTMLQPQLLNGQIPIEIIQEIFSRIPLAEVFKFTRLCKAAYKCIRQKDFARQSLVRQVLLLNTVNSRMKSVKQTHWDKLWFLWPEECQYLYTKLFLVTVDEIHWTAAAVNGVDSGLLELPTIPRSIQMLHLLTSLCLTKGMIQGPLPRELWTVASLETLDLSFNNLARCCIPSDIRGLKNLVRLDFSNCGLSGTIPAAIGSLSQLKTLNLSHNSLEGGVPHELSLLSRLEAIYLDSNKLRGDIPLLSLSEPTIKIISLSNNEFTGPIPSSFGSLRALEHLNLSHNNLTHTIPHPFQPSLTLLNCSSNTLTGCIPPALFSSRSNLVVLDLANNGLTGRIPKESEQMIGRLRVLNLSGNRLKGVVPKRLRRVPVLAELEVDLSRNELLRGVNGVTCTIL